MRSAERDGVSARLGKSVIVRIDSEPALSRSCGEIPEMQVGVFGDVDTLVDRRARLTVAGCGVRICRKKAGKRQSRQNGYVSH